MKCAAREVLVERSTQKECVYPYLNQSIQLLDPADFDNRLEFCCWLTREKNYSSEFSALQDASTTLLRKV